MLYTPDQEDILRKYGLLVGADEIDDHENQYNNLTAIVDIGKNIFGTKQIQTMYERVDQLTCKNLVLNNRNQQRNNILNLGQVYSRQNSERQGQNKSTNRKCNTQRNSTHLSRLEQQFMKIQEDDWISIDNHSVQADHNQQKNQQKVKNSRLSDSRKLINNNIKVSNKSLTEHKQNAQKSQILSSSKASLQSPKKTIKQASKHLTQPVKNFKKKTLQEVREKKQRQQEEYNKMMQIIKSKKQLSQFYNSNNSHIPVYEKSKITQSNKLHLQESRLKQLQLGHPTEETFKPKINISSSRIVQETTFQERMAENKEKKIIKQHKIINQVLQQTPFKPKINMTQKKVQSKIKNIWSKSPTKNLKKNPSSNQKCNIQDDQIDLFTFSEQYQDIADLDDFDQLKGISQSMLRTGSFFSDDFATEQPKCKKQLLKKKLQQDDCLALRLNSDDSKLFLD